MKFIECSSVLFFLFPFLCSMERELYYSGEDPPVEDVGPGLNFVEIDTLHAFAHHSRRLHILHGVDKKKETGDKIWARASVLNVGAQILEFSCEDDPFMPDAEDKTPLDRAVERRAPDYICEWLLYKEHSQSGYYFEKYVRRVLDRKSDKNVLAVLGRYDVTKSPLSFAAAVDFFERCVLGMMDRCLESLRLCLDDKRYTEVKRFLKRFVFDYKSELLFRQAACLG